MLQGDDQSTVLLESNDDSESEDMLQSKSRKRCRSNTDSSIEVFLTKQLASYKHHKNACMIVHLAKNSTSFWRWSARSSYVYIP